MQAVADMCVSTHLKLWIYFSQPKKHEMLEENKARLIMYKPLYDVVASHVNCCMQSIVPYMEHHDECAWKIFDTCMLMLHVVESHECLATVSVHLQAVKCPIKL